jgi:hypothetical protein
MKKRHSLRCPCAENIKVQMEFFSGLVKQLSKKDPKQQSRWISEADPCFIRYLSRCAKGILNGDIKLSRKRIRELKPDKKILIKLVRKSIPLEKKREFIQRLQRGGFFQLLPGIAAAALSAIIGKQVANLI